MVSQPENSEDGGHLRLLDICKLVSKFIFNFRPICLLYVKNKNKYSYEKYINAKFGISTLVYLNYKCGFYSSISLIQSGQTNTQTTIEFFNNIDVVVFQCKKLRLYKYTKVVSIFFSQCINFTFVIYCFVRIRIMKTLTYDESRQLYYTGKGIIITGDMNSVSW